MVEAGRQPTSDARAVYAAHAEVLRVLSNPLRHEIVHHLAAGDQTVTSLVALTGAGKASVSQHVALLRSHGLVAADRRGRIVLFRLAYPELAQACALIDEVLADQAAVNARLFAKPVDMERE